MHRVCKSAQGKFKGGVLCTSTIEGVTQRGHTAHCVRVVSDRRAQSCCVILRCSHAKTVSQSVSHYHTPSRELMDHTHSTVLLSSTVIISATFVFLFFLCLLSSARAASHLRMIFFTLRFSPLLLVVDLDENGPRC